MIETDKTFIEATTTAGRVRGFWRGASAAFLGIPFAEPPVGELRFAAPVPYAAWEGVLDAVEYGATPQRKQLSEVTLIPEPSIAGESTLNVNVFTPSLETSLPVLVYIHGGGFLAGSPASPWYDGAAFNRDGVVTVSVSYRLGFDGFGWIDGAPHNRGVLDWLLALEWVRDNIANFGGDPSKVTIAGQSAGGGAVLTLLGMPRAQGLFHRVYCISGAVADVTPERAKAAANKLALAAGVEPTRAGFASLTEEQLLIAQGTVADIGGEGDPMEGLTTMLEEGLILGPVIDGDLITRSSLDFIRAGVGANIPLVLGATDDEFSMAFNEAKNQLRFTTARFLLGKMGLKGQRRRDYLAANRNIKGTAARLGRYMTDKMFRVAALRIVEARADAPTWLYRFAWRSPVHGFAVHCLDLPFFFDCLGADGVTAVAGDAPPQSLADTVHADAVSFVKEGNPNWPTYSDQGSTQVFDTPSTVQLHGYDTVRALAD
ncbi:MAG TPA: carboxylesterase family protein [Galbitalea sp.]